MQRSSAPAHSLRGPSSAIFVVARRQPSTDGASPLRAGIYTFSPSTLCGTAETLLKPTKAAMAKMMLWTGAPGDRQKVDGGSPSR